MVLDLQAFQQAAIQRLLYTAPWLIWGVAIMLIAAVLRDWIPLWPDAEGRAIDIPALAPDSSSQSVAKTSAVSIATFDSKSRVIIPWFGIFNLEEHGMPPPPEAIEISQRNLHLVGISTSTSPNESFALIKSGNGEIKSLKNGDAVEPGVELMELLPNAAILKAGDHWEKLYLGDPPAGIAHSMAGGISNKNNGATHTVNPGTATMPNSGMRPGTKIRSDSEPRRRDNPNLSNRDIRERMNALMAAFQQ